MASEGVYKGGLGSFGKAADSVGTEAKTALALRTEDRPTESGRGSPTWKKPAMKTPELRGVGHSLARSLVSAR